MQKSIRTLGIYFSLTVMLIVLLFPFAVMLSTSLKSLKEIYQGVYWIPKEFEFQNYVNVWFGTERYRSIAIYFQNSLFISAGATLITCALSIPSAYAISRLRFPGRGLMMYLLLVLQMFSPVVIVISIFKIVSDLNLIDTPYSLILVNGVMSVAFSTWMMTGYFATIPKELEEAARIDGCNRLEALIKIILPLARPGVITIIIFSFIVAWNEFMYTFTFISSVEKMPISTGLYRYVGRDEVQWHQLMSASVLAIIPIVVLFLSIEKNLVGGLTGGSVKG